MEFSAVTKRFGTSVRQFSGLYQKKKIFCHLFFIFWLSHFQAPYETLFFQLFTANMTVLRPILASNRQASDIRPTRQAVFNDLEVIEQRRYELRIRGPGYFVLGVHARLPLSALDCDRRHKSDTYEYWIPAHPVRGHDKAITCAQVCFLHPPPKKRGRHRIIVWTKIGSCLRAPRRRGGRVVKKKKNRLVHVNTPKRHYR